MTFGLIAHTAKGSTGTGFPSGVTSAAINTTGANLIIISRTDFGSGDVSVSDSASNTWTSIVDYRPANNVWIGVFYCLNPITSSSHTFSTPTDAQGTFPAIAVAAFSGANALHTFTNNTTAGASTLQPGSITPANNNALLYACGASASTSTTITGMTVLDDIAFASSVHLGFTHGYVIQGSAAALNPTFNFNTSNIASAVQCDFYSGQLIQVPMTGVQQDLTGGCNG